MCILTIIQDLFHHHVELWGPIFSVIPLVLNILLLIFFLFELHLNTDFTWRAISHAPVMVLLSMSSAILSSAFFVLSAAYPTPFICTCGPIIAISFRILSKTFTWAFAIVRGRLVIESLNNEILSKLTNRAPFILIFQCFLINALSIAFTKSNGSNYADSCYVELPFWSLFLNAVIGELFYGLSFIYIFWRAMTISIDRCLSALRPSDAQETRRHIWHHVKMYILQLITSIIFLFLVSLCICFETVILFEAELFLSNIFLCLLFGKTSVFCQTRCCTSCASFGTGSIDTNQKKGQNGSLSMVRTMSAPSGSSSGGEKKQTRQIKFKESTPVIPPNLLIPDQWKSENQVKIDLNILRQLHDRKSEELKPKKLLIYHRHSKSLNLTMNNASMCILKGIAKDTKSLTPTHSTSTDNRCIQHAIETPVDQASDQTSTTGSSDLQTPITRPATPLTPDQLPH